MDNRSPQHIVDERFSTVSLGNPINAMLFRLALNSELSNAIEPRFNQDMHQPIPDADQLLAMKKKVSLLPLNTITHRIKLPSVPGVFLQLRHAMEQGSSSEKLAEILHADPKLTAAVLSLINSALFSPATPVESVSRAITILGTREISSLALVSQLMTMFDDSTPEGFSLECFWKHSITTAVLSHDIAHMLNRANPEKYLIAGLLHDLGQVMLFSCYPQLARTALALVQQKHLDMSDAEKLMFDVDHSMVGGVFFAEWSLPESVVQAALYHHAPQHCIGKDVPEVVYVANQIATALGLGSHPLYTSNPDVVLWKNMNLSEKQLAPLIADVEERLWRLFSSLFPQSCLS